MGGVARAERRRQARAATRSRTLYHGTAAVLVGAIERDGLTTGQEDRVFLTDSRAAARVYATWSAARRPTGPREGAIFTIKVPSTIALTVERDSFPPPLPWQTKMLAGIVYYVEQAIPPDLLEPPDVFEIAELTDLGTLEAVRRETERLCRGFDRAGAATHTSAPAMHRSSLRAAIPDHWSLLAAIVEASPNAASKWHGESHWRGVLAASVRLIERGSKADPAVLTAFCLLHDSQRKSEGHDPRHGERAARFADELHDEGLLALDARQRDLLRRALVDHDCGMTSRDATIGACWDADRLTLGRVGIKVDTRLLSTPEGRELADEPGSVPEGDACDWSWALSRTFLLATTERLAVAA